MGPNINEWEKIMMFRCVQDPMIGPRPRNAFMLPELPEWEAWLHTASGTIFVKTSHGRRHVVGMGNWSSIELYKAQEAPAVQQAHAAPKEEAHGTLQNSNGTSIETTDKEPRGPGRPRKEAVVQA